MLSYRINNASSEVRMDTNTIDQQYLQAHMDQLRQKAAARRSRRELIKSLGDTEDDWHDTPSAQEIASYVKHMVAYPQQNSSLAERYIARFGSKQFLLEHLESAAAS